jgi:hypothetical protein
MWCRGLLFLSALSVVSCVDLSLPSNLQRIPAVIPAIDADVAPDTAMSSPAQVDAGAPTPPVPVDAAPLAVGRRCARNADCESGSCADGVCCSSACTAVCFACNQPGMEGTCLAVPVGMDPSSECNQEPVATCGLDGTCDGAGSCRRYPAATLCQPGSCTGALEQAARTCDGMGVCQVGTSRSCAPNACAGSSCGTMCGSNSDCQTGFLCEGGICRNKRPQGMACTSASQCATGYCADGICCGTPCTESCHACNLSSSLGTCTPVADGADPGNDCPAESASSCGRAGGCNGKGVCRLHAAGTTCALPACSNGKESTARTCDGAGQCTGGTTRDCGNFACASEACATTCVDSAQCKSGYTCVGTTCELPTVTLPPPPPPPPPPPVPSLVLNWKMDEETGSMAVDASPSAFHGTYIGDSGAPASSTVAPVLMFPNPRSRAFTRRDRHAIQLATTPAALKPANNFTVSIWFQATGVDNSGAVELLSAGNQYLVRAGMDYIRFSKRPAGGSNSVQCEAQATTCMDGKWHHVVAVQTSAGMKVYVDGAERCTNTRGEDIRYDGSAALFVGRHPDSANYDFEGNVDDVRIYNAALTPAQVVALFQGGQ